MQNYSRKYLYGHGYKFLIWKSPEGYTISLNGKWLYRTKKLSSIKPMCNRFGLAEFRKELGL